jgi:hypothetical protein
MFDCGTVGIVSGIVVWSRERINVQGLCTIPIMTSMEPYRLRTSHCLSFICDDIVGNGGRYYACQGPSSSGTLELTQLEHWRGTLPVATIPFSDSEGEVDALPKCGRAEG